MSSVHFDPNNDNNSLNESMKCQVLKLRGLFSGKVTFATNNEGNLYQQYEQPALDLSAEEDSQQIKTIHYFTKLK